MSKETNPAKRPKSESKSTGIGNPEDRSHKIVLAENKPVDKPGRDETAQELEAEYGILHDDVPKADGTVRNKAL